MQKIWLIIIFSFVSLISTSAQITTGKEINNRDIEWSDFSGKIDETSKWDASTYWVTTYSYSTPNFEGNSARVNLTVRLFLRADSWFKPNKKSDRLLEHERGHFKIGRICTKELVVIINSMSFDRNNYRQEIDAVYWKIIEKYKQINAQYEQDTDHYKNIKQQELWNKKLDDLLNQ